MKITAVVLTKNEEKNIERCLKSLDFCHEIIIIDDYSTDNTLDIVYKACKNIKLFKKELKGNFAEQRNFAMSKAKNDWVLFIDADEEISEELKKEIRNLESDFRRDGKRRKWDDNFTNIFYIKRRDYFWGKELRFGEVKKIRSTGLIRLVNKNSGKWQGNVHEEFVVKNKKIRVERLNSFINHYPHQTLKEFINDINYYSTLRAKELFNQGKKTSVFEIIFFPFFKFIYNYIINLGFLDGAIGFVYSFMMSFHSFLVRAKLYQIITNDKQ